VRIDWYEIGGQRVELADLDRYRVTESRCDGCGEFMSERETVTIQGAQIYQPGAPMVFLPNLTYHVDHLPKAFIPFLTEGR
jgi:hypothetical protein